MPGLRVEYDAMRFNLVEDEDGQRLECVALDGRILFVVEPSSHTGIDVRCAQLCNIEGGLYGEGMSIVPKGCRDVTILARKYSGV